MDEESNIGANISLAAGIITWVLVVVHMCMGCVPFLGMFAIMLLPIEMICALTAIIGGGVGIGVANSLEEGTGKPQGIIGLCLGLFYFLAAGGMFLLGMVLGVSLILMDSMFILG